MVAEGLIEETPNGIALRGGYCSDRQKYLFPLPERYEEEGIDPVTLKQEGTLWSYTVQRFPPKDPFKGERDPAAFQPYAVGYVELEDQIIVEARLKTQDFDALTIGAPMSLTLLEFAADQDGTPLVTYAFEPTPAGGVS
ncbi:MAG: OB-fold domain-containing protein [Pseudomonadota bacterium]